MRALLERLFTFPATRLVRAACYLGILALLLMSWSALVPAALPIVIGMSVGQAIGVLAFLCYALAIYYEMRRKATLPDSAPPPEPEPEGGVSVDAD